jgi:hypothetical protein
MNPMIISRKIHRILVIIISILGFVMMTTGTIIKFPEIFVSFGINVYFMREIHNTFSIFFSIIFFGMAVTGIVMYVYPILLRKSSTKN